MLSPIQQKSQKDFVVGGWMDEGLRLEGVEGRRRYELVLLVVALSS
jgi:hypothetical protein